MYIVPTMGALYIGHSTILRRQYISHHVSSTSMKYLGKYWIGSRNVKSRPNWRVYLHLNFKGERATKKHLVRNRCLCFLFYFAKN